jgi:hypothetical protein
MRCSNPAICVVFPRLDTLTPYRMGDYCLPKKFQQQKFGYGLFWLFSPRYANRSPIGGLRPPDEKRVF